MVVTQGGQDLNRTARRLAISPTQLAHARGALREATDLALVSQPVPVEQICMLGEAWVRLHRSGAGSAIAALIAQLRAAAAGASDMHVYQQYSVTAESLAEALGQLEPGASLEQLERWPPPPRDTETTGGWPQDHTAGMRSRALEQLVYRNPEQAVRYLAEIQQTLKPDDLIRTAQIAARFTSAGLREAGDALFDKLMQDCQSRMSEGKGLDLLEVILTQLPYMAPERLPEVLDLFLRASRQAASSARFGGTLTVADESVAVTYEEAVVLNTLRSLHNRPGVTLSLLSAFPDLKGKLDRLGGIDRFLSPRQHSDGPVTVSYDSPTGRRNMTFGVASPASMRRRGPASPATEEPALNADSLMKELGGKALRNPLPVRARLEEIAGDSANAELLLQLAQRASHSDPEMSALAFQALRPLLHQVNPLHRRADLLRMFVMTSRNCEGAVDPAVLQEGFVLADLIRQDEKEAADRLPAGRRSPADELEAFLVAQLARDDYPSAIRYVRTLPPAERLRMLAQIVQTLQHN